MDAEVEPVPLEISEFTLLPPQDSGTPDEEGHRGVLRFSQTSYIMVTMGPFDPSVVLGQQSSLHSSPILFTLELGGLAWPGPLVESASSAETICSGQGTGSCLNE